LCPFLYFCTPLKVDHDSSLAFRILAGNPKTGCSLRGGGLGVSSFIWKAKMFHTTHKQQSDYLKW
jgi:hypothetical protein